MKPRTLDELQTVLQQESVREFLTRFTERLENGSEVLDTRTLISALEKAGYLPDEYLPAAGRPEQQHISVTAWLQIAQEGFVVPASLEEFNNLVTVAVRSQFVLLLKSTNRSSGQLDAFWSTRA